MEEKKPTIILGGRRLSRTETALVQAATLGVVPLTAAAIKAAEAVRGQEVTDVIYDEVAKMSPLQWRQLYLGAPWEAVSTPKAPHQEYFDPPPFKADGTPKRRPQ